MKEIKFYKLTLELDKKLNKDRINLLDRLQDLVEAKSMFNQANAGRKHLVILNLTPQSANLLLRLDGFASKSVGIRTIGLFISALNGGPGSKTALTANVKQSFKLAEAKPVEYEKSRAIIDTLYSGGNEFIDPSDMQKLFFGLQEASANVEADDSSIENEAACSTEPDDKAGAEDCNGSVDDRKPDSPDVHSDSSSADCGDSQNPGEEFPTTSLQNALEKISAMAGYAEYKEEIAGIVKLAQLGKESGKAADGYGIPYSYVFTGDAGMDHEIPARLMAEVFWHLGLVKKRRFVIVNIPEDGNEYSGINLENSMDPGETGIVFVKGIFDGEEDNIDPKKVLNKLSDKMKQYKSRLLFILSYHIKEDKGICEKVLLDILDSGVNYRRIVIPAYSGAELAELIEAAAKKMGCTVSQEAVSLIIEKMQKVSGTALSVDYILEKAFSDKAFALLESKANLGGLSVLEVSDLGFIGKAGVSDNMGNISRNMGAETALPLINTKTVSSLKGTEPYAASVDPVLELNSMTGLAEVKNRVRQICNVLTVRTKKKELGLESKPVCLHMQFVGNPGTGKTTVARIMGRILRDLGLLSSGHFIELTRNDLIGEYIGQTTPKVKKAIKRSKGGIMFIDEAYSLYQGSENDYGYEAVSELLKAMEDLKDDLVVIFAGYPKEMEKMVNMNPGLRDRIAFKIEFPDYSPDELIEIFVRMCDENSFIITGDALEALGGLIRKHFSTKLENFGNARIIRKFFERVEIIQSGRICEENGFDGSKINVIERADIEKLYDDTEIRTILKNSANSKAIGFRQSM